MIRNYEIHRAREILRFGCQAYLQKASFKKISFKTGQMLSFLKTLRMLLPSYHYLVKKKFKKQLKAWPHSEIYNLSSQKNKRIENYSHQQTLKRVGKCADIDLSSFKKRLQ